MIALDEVHTPRKQIWEETIKGGEEMLVVDPEAKYQEVYGP